jgi:hypothetical protein
MRRSVFVFALLAAGSLFGSAAYAGDNESPIRGNGAISVARNEPGAQHGHTVDQINRALDFFGRPSLGTSRILHNDRDGSRDRETVKTYTESTVTYHSGNK